MTFKNYQHKYETQLTQINEAFNFRPTKELIIPKSIKNYTEINKMYNFLAKTFPHWEEVMTIDKDKGKVKILRDLKQEIENLPPEIKSKITSFDCLTSDIYGNGSKKANINSLGQALTNAGELATVASLSKTIETPQDTEQDIFINNPEAFLRWKNTFVQTKIAVEKIIKHSIDSYTIIHDATDTSDFSKVIKKFTNKIKTAKDTWCPADIFLIKTSDFKEIIKKLDYIIETNNSNLISAFNTEIYTLYEQGLMYPISLKQITTSPKVDYTNIPNSMLKFDKIINEQFNVSFDLTSSEIGVMRFKNAETGKSILMQHRGFPRKYSTCQTEITSDGSLTGGRVGKVPTRIIDSVLGDYNYKRVKTMKFFGQNKQGKMLINFDSNKRKEVLKMYEVISKSKYVKMDKSATSKNFKTLLYSIDSKTEDEIINYTAKIQGLILVYFFIKEDKNISVIINDMLNGAKKINKKASFFIKIY